MEKKPAFKSETLTINSVPLLLMSWSSPKLSDLNSTEMETVKDVDLIVYTLKMDDATFQPKDITMMCNLVEIFGADFYKKAVFVLTNANKVGSLDKNNKHIINKEIMETKKNEWRRTTIVKLEEVCGVKLESIPFVPAGHSDIKMLFDKHWPTEVLRAFLSQLEDVNYPALVKICEQQFEFLLCIHENQICTNDTTITRILYRAYDYDVLCGVFYVKYDRDLSTFVKLVNLFFSYHVCTPFFPECATYVYLNTTFKNNEKRGVDHNF